MEGAEYRHTGHGVQEPVFVPVHAGRSDNGSLRERITDRALSGRFAAVKFRGRCAARVQVGHVHHARCTVLCRDLGNEASRPLPSAAIPS